MRNELITIQNANGEKKEYKILAVIDKDYKYIVYTDTENIDYKSNLYVAKVKRIDKIEETLNISDDEWIMIEKEYKKIVDA